MDPTTLIVLALVALLLLKPDLLDSLLGKRPRAGAGGGGGGGGYPPVMTPPTSGGGPPGSTLPAWHEDTGAGAVEAFNREHPCPAGQQFNTFSKQCQPLGVWMTEPAPVPGPAPQPPQARPSPPQALFDIKASNYRDSRFTPFSGA